ncbi:g11487 [Coccomyxa elongata]
MPVGQEACMQQNGAMNGNVSEHATAQTTEVPSTQPPPTAAAGAGRAVQHCFSEEILDNTVHFQIMDLGRQLYIWVGTGAAQMGSLAMASPLGTQTGTGRQMPPVAMLVKGANEDGSASLAQRLAARVGRPVAVAWSLPEEPPALGLVAERRLMRELQVLQLIADSRNLSMD